MRDRETGTGKGFAFVRYLEASAATVRLTGCIAQLWRNLRS